MNNGFICCSKCLATIAKHNTTAARLWLDLCDVHANPIFVKGQDIPELRVLEHLGFVISTETTETLAIRLNGEVRKDGNLDSFCINRGKHD